MKKVIAFVSIIVSILMFAFTGVSAGGDFEDAYSENRVCFVHNEFGYEHPVPVVDTWVLALNGEVNAGYTSMSLDPCIPTACPEGYTLVSSNVCSSYDPFGHLPVVDPGPPNTSPPDGIFVGGEDVAVGQPPVPGATVSETAERGPVYMDELPATGTTANVLAIIGAILIWVGTILYFATRERK